MLTAKPRYIRHSLESRQVRRRHRASPTTNPKYGESDIRDSDIRAANVNRPR